MRGMTATGAIVPDTQPAPAWLDRPVLETPLVAGDEERTVARMDRSDRLDHPPGRHVASRRPASIARRQTVREARDTVLEDDRTTCSMDRAIDAAAAAHPVVGGVDDGVDLLRGDVAEDGGHVSHVS